MCQATEKVKVVTKTVTEYVYKEAVSLKRIVLGKSKEVPSPKGRIPQSDIRYEHDTLRIKVGRVSLTSVVDSNSMEPLIDAGFTVIKRHENPDGIIVGDVIVWDAGDHDVIHSVVEIGSDDNGRYFITEGINNSRPDTTKVRDSMIKYVILGILFTEGD